MNHNVKQLALWGGGAWVLYYLYKTYVAANEPEITVSVGLPVITSRG